MKKLFSLLLVAFLSAAVVSCSSGENGDKPKTDSPAANHDSAKNDSVKNDSANKKVAPDTSKKTTVNPTPATGPKLDSLEGSFRSMMA